MTHRPKICFEGKTIVELLEVCLRTTYFQADDVFFQQNVDILMANALSPIISNIYMGHFHKLSLDSEQYRPSLWLCYVDDTFLVRPRGTEQLQNFLSNLKNLRPFIQFTLEMESARILL
jgi:hypothetical protein